MLIGIVGKPNVGKSTFFKALTLADVHIDNYPFVTIKPNEGFAHARVECAAKFFNVQCNPRVGYCIDQNRYVPIKVMDVAGLVPGAHEGKGMGNQFLDDLRQAKVLIHVIDVAGTTNEVGESVNPGSYDPANDIKFLEEELDFWYQGILLKGWEKFARRIVQERQEIHKALAKQLSGLGVDEPMMEAVITQLKLDSAKPNLWSEMDLLYIAVELRKITKPMIIVCNKADVSSAQANYERLKEQFPHLILIPCSAESELALREAANKKLIKYLPGDSNFEILDKTKLTDKQQHALQFIKTHILDVYGSTGVQQAINTAVFDLLKLMAIFPGGVSKLADSDGNVLPDCFLLKPGSTALDFAYHLHTDLGNNFIRAIDVKTKRTVGKEYPLKSGDVIEIITAK
ncbi:MAG: redox-regulated ATPase YchF [Candidatus Woesearchaeota archaeon]